MDLLLRFTHSGLLCKGGSSKSIRDIQEGSELASFREKAGGAGVRAAFSGIEVLAGATVPLLNISPTQLA